MCACGCDEGRRSPVGVGYVVMMAVADNPLLEADLAPWSTPPRHMGRLQGSPVRGCYVLWFGGSGPAFSKVYSFLAVMCLGHGGMSTLDVKAAALEGEARWRIYDELCG